MKAHNNSFNGHEALHGLKYFLPVQAALKDFIHHNTLYAWQKFKFYEGIRNASGMVGYKISLSLHTACEIKDFLVIPASNKALYLSDY